MPQSIFTTGLRNLNKYNIYKNNDNIGIGINNPQELLHIYSNSGLSTL